MTTRTQEAQDLCIVSKGTARPGQVFVGSILTNSIVGQVSVEILENNVVISIHRADKGMGPVSVVYE